MQFAARPLHAGPVAALVSALLAPVKAGMAQDADKIPDLLPPRGEIPPGFWEQNAAGVALAGALLAVATLVVAWWIWRPRPRAPAPPEDLAREQLSMLSKQPESGASLTRVSRALRCYLGSILNLPPGELTTTEFCQAIATVPLLGPDLPGAIAGFLRRCDERKFAPQSSVAPLNAAQQALGFVEACEALRHPPPSGEAGALERKETTAGGGSR